MLGMIVLVVLILLLLGAGVALQPGLGLLPKRRTGARPGDRYHPLADGPHLTGR
jgi:hypothetical protein